MPTYGREGVSQYLLGSVTEKVVRSAPVPVITVGQGSSDSMRWLVSIDPCAYVADFRREPSCSQSTAVRANERGAQPG